MVGKTIHSKERALIFKVLTFFEHEKEISKFVIPVDPTKSAHEHEKVIKKIIIPVDQPINRACAATGISKSTLMRLKKQMKSVESSVSLVPSTSTSASIPEPSTPGKKRKTSSKKISLDSYDLVALRNIVNSFYTVKNEVPTLKKILAAAKQDLNFPDHKFVADNVPYSCCAIEALYPCIHHGVTQKGVVYKYDPEKQLTISKAGCEEKLINEMMTVSWNFNAVMALIVLAMILQIIAVRYLHTAYKNGLNAGFKFPCRAYLLRSLTDTSVNKPVVKKMFRKRRKVETRTLQWVLTGYKRKKRINTSGSADNSSDELLKPINE